MNSAATIDAEIATYVAAEGADMWVCETFDTKAGIRSWLRGVAETVISELPETGDDWSDEILDAATARAMTAHAAYIKAANRAARAAHAE